jgi:DNA repair and recombination RAD54-like protein
MRILREIWATDSEQKVVIFSTFTECLNLVAEALKAEGVSSFTIDGSTTLQKRSRLISDFQNPTSRTKVCLITSRCGNAGLTLTAANHLLLLEPCLSPHVEQQAAARIHRFGQLKPVTIHRLVAKGTIEELIWQQNHAAELGLELQGSVLDALERAVLGLNEE